MIHLVNEEKEQWSTMMTSPLTTETDSAVSLTPGYQPESAPHTSGTGTFNIKASYYKRSRVQAFIIIIIFIRLIKYFFRMEKKCFQDSPIQW